MRSFFILLCVGMAIFALTELLIGPAIVFFFIAWLLDYFSPEKAGTRADEERRKREEERQRNVLATARARFSNNELVQMIVRNLQYEHWESVSTGETIDVYKDKICTPTGSYKLSDYGYNNIDCATQEQMAWYFGDCMPIGWEYSIKKIEKIVGGSCTSFSATGLSDGTVSFSPGGDYSDITIGYSVGRTNVPSPTNHLRDM